MNPSEINAIDVHAHFGVYLNSANPLANEMMSADAAAVAARAARAHTEWTIVSPLKAIMPRGGADAEAGNTEADAIVPRIPGLLQWVVIDPRRPNSVVQADQMLRKPTCVGIKIHPEEHQYPIAEFGRSIFEFAAARNAVVLSHSGEGNSLPADLARFADDFETVRLILAHLGFGWNGDLALQVRAVQASRHGNVFTDTSSASSLMPNLIEWSAKRIGADKILYGTDSPLYSAAMQRARIDHAELPDADKQLILRGNARRLLQIPATPRTLESPESPAQGDPDRKP